MRKIYFILSIALIIAFTSSSYSQVWTQVGEDIDGEAAEDQFGNSMDLSADGNIIAIGGWQNDGNGADAGHVRVFENKNETWTQVGKDIEGNEGEKLGFAVSLNNTGDIVALSTPYVNSNTGKVSIYQNVNGVWTQMGDDIYGKGEYYYSGVSIELSPDGKLIAISNHANEGYIRLYKFADDEWTMTAEISGTLYNEQLGASGLKFNNDATIIAARPSSGTYHPFVRVFKNIGEDNWEQIGDSIPGAGSAFSLSRDGTTVAAGTRGYYSGEVYVYKNINETWVPKGDTISLPHPAVGYSLSSQISSDGNLLMVSQPGDGNGLVLTYIYRDGKWIKSDYEFSGEGNDDEFGLKMVLSSNDSVLAVSAPRNDEVGTDAGHVRIFKYWDNTPLHVELIDSVCENELPYQFGTKILNAEGTYKDTLEATNGVDSIVTLTLLIHELPNPDFTVDADTLASVEIHSSYQWYDEDGIIEGATSSQYIIEKSGTYYLEATNENGCSAMSDGISMIKTGINDLANKNQLDLVVIPNPNDGRFRLRFGNGKVGTHQIQVINELGQVQFEKEIYLSGAIHEEEFELSHLLSGNYFVKVFDGRTSKTKKIILK